MKHKLHLKAQTPGMGTEGVQGEGHVSALEYAQIMQQEADEHFKSREVLLQWYLSHNARKLAALGFLIDFINAHHLQKVLSLGAGPCVLEYLLKCALGPSSVVCATDFNNFLIEKARIHLPGVRALVFDFAQPDIALLSNEAGPFELVVFFGSLYVLDDEPLIQLLEALRKNGVDYIIDFQAGYIDHWIRGAWDRGRLLLSRLLRKHPLWDMARRLKSLSPMGKCHGYARTRGELRALYRRAGLTVVQETTAGAYRYVAVCEANRHG